MRRRGVAFTTVLLLAAMLVTAPFVAGAVHIAWDMRRNGHLQYDFLGFEGSYWHGSSLDNAKMVDGRFHYHYTLSKKTPPFLTPVVVSVDPESDSRSDQLVMNSLSPDFELKFYAGSSQFYAGDANHLWMIIGSGYVLELERDRCVEKTPVRADASPFPINRSIRNRNDVFCLDGQLTAILWTTDGQWELFQLHDGDWESRGLIELLDTSRDWQVSGDASSIVPLSELNSFSKISVKLGEPAFGDVVVLPIGSTGHLFWNVCGRLLYRAGINLQPSASASPHGSIAPVDEPVSALEPVNTIGITHDWFLVHDNIRTMKWFPIAVGAAPAILLVDESTVGSPKLTALRLEHGRWKEFATSVLPFPSLKLNVGSNSNGSVAYFAAAGLWGRLRMYAIEPAGFRKTRYEVLPWRGMSGFLLIAETMFWSLVSALVPATVAELLMWNDRKRYEFRHQSVRLATLWERGIARCIDFLLILIVIAGVFYGLTFYWDVDWLSAAEIRTAGNASMVANDPSIVAATKIGLAIGIILIIAIPLLIVAQGRYGATPGKWVCGLRTVRATLEPCGFARSLVRELLLCVDSLNLLSWTPGILFVAFTESRQRFGDLVADTIVVRAKSLAQAK